MTKIPIRSDTVKFWTQVHDYKKRYSYWCETPTISPRPELVGRSFGHFARVPLTQGGFDIAVWGFLSAEQRNRFAEKYAATDWAP